MPLHLLLGLRNSETPSLALQRRRMSLGISLKYRHCSFGFQIGPSVNRKPVHNFSTTASLSTNRSNSDDFTSMGSPIQFSLHPIFFRRGPRRAQFVLSHSEQFIDAICLNFALGRAGTLLSDALSGEHPMGHRSGLSRPPGALCLRAS